MEKFVFIDIDGTLYDHGNRCIPESAKKALQLAKANGHKLFICTGRPKPIVEPSFLELPITGIVYAAGAHIEQNHKILFHAEFPHHVIDEILAYFHEHEIEYSLEGSKCSYYKPKMFEMFEGFLCKGDTESEIYHIFNEKKTVKLLDEFTDNDVKQVLKIDFFAKNDKQIREFMQNLPKEVDGFLYHEPYGDLIEGEIIIDGVDKASSIDRVLEYFCGTLEQTIALGDSANDMTMLQHAQFGIAMGNASEPLKQVADYVTKPVDEDGLYHAFVVAGLIEE